MCNVKDLVASSGEIAECNFLSTDHASTCINLSPATITVDSRLFRNWIYLSLNVK